MKPHDDYRELAALRLYGELDASDRERLELHLAQCAPCSSFARELEAGLGRLAAAPARADLPQGWREELQRELAAERGRDLWRSPLWIAAASFLAGAALTWSVSGGRGAGQQDGPAKSAGLPAIGSSASFERSTPPPRARDGASLPPLAELYLQR